MKITVSISDITTAKTTPSWVIVHNKTGEVVFETYSAKIAKAIDFRKYHAVPILEYLQGLNDKKDNE